MRTYFHLDMDAFFVSVEELFDPSLKGKPVVVGGKSNERGVVSAASYAARKFGVHSAMPLRTAYKLCPQAIFVEGHRERYVEYSGKVYGVLQKFSPRVEMASIDEAYLDLTGTERLLGPPLAAAHALHNAVQGATKLNCSIGAASSRLVAKIASDQAKPHGILWIPPGCEARFLAPLDVRKIPGVGKVTERNLHDCGIRKIGDLARLEQSSLEERFGKWGLALAGKSRGEDAGGWFDGEIGEDDDPKSISHEHTFSVDTADVDALEAARWCASRRWSRAVFADHHLHARTVQIKLRLYRFLHLHSCPNAGTHATQDRHRVLRRGPRDLFLQELDVASRSARCCVYAQLARKRRGPDQPARRARHERWRKYVCVAGRQDAREVWRHAVSRSPPTSSRGVSYKSA